MAIKNKEKISRQPARIATRNVAGGARNDKEVLVKNKEILRFAQDDREVAEKRVLSEKKLKAQKCAKQAQGTLLKVTAMIEGGRYCPEVIQQIDSVIGLLKTTKRELLAGHLDTCVAHQMAEDKDKAIEELLKIYNLSN